MGGLFKDKNGKVVVWQFPNPALVLWVLATLVAKFTTDTTHDLANIIAFGALFTWAWLEIFAGASWFRRLLGLVVLVGAVRTRLSA